MKIARICLIAFFLLGLVSSPAHAQGGVMGYVVLVGQASPDLPFFDQARHAFSRLAPELLAAQKSGSILSFEPDLAAGLVRIEFAPGAQVSALQNGLQVYAYINQAVKDLPRMEAQVQETIGSDASPMFYLSLNSGCPYYYNMGANAHVIGSLRDKTGKIIAAYESIADASGYGSGCFSGSYSSLLPGYKVTFKVYNSSGVYQTTYSASAPSLSFTSLNNPNSVASGRGPAGKTYSVYWNHKQLDANNNQLSIYRNGTFTSTGTWSQDFGTTPFRGGDYFNIYTSSGAFTFRNYFYAPYAYCELGSTYCEIDGFSGQPASLSIKHAGVTHTFTGKFNKWGYFYVNLEDSSGSPLFLAPGDVISGTGISPWSLKTLSVASINYATDMFSGKAPASKYFWVYVETLPNYSWYSRWVGTNSSGSYAANFHSSLDLKPASAFNLEVYYIDPLTGNGEDFYQAVGP